MIKGPYGVGHGIVSTCDVAEVVFDLLDNASVFRQSNLCKVYERIKRMDEQVQNELKLLATIEDQRGKVPVVVSEPKEWYIHNAAKAETRGALLEYLLGYIEKRLASGREK
jgi:hypothetical protein